jgi:catechol 2,3-dioxygenase-like lactoylglutathione lyase family enzyme
MTDLSFVLLYVADVPRAEAFYADVLGRSALESSPGFAMFEAAPGIKLGLWRADEVAPKATPPGGGEVCIVAESDAAVEAAAAAWRAKGHAVALAPTRLDFGYTFVGLDPDGHRLRVFAPGGPA